jgi:hypothetical protein
MRRVNELTLPPRRSAGPAPPRAPGSVRRTSSIDASWPKGHGGPLRLTGRARDLLTPRSGGPPVVLAEDGLDVLLDPERRILSIAAWPERPGLAGLVGARAGGGLRRALAEVAPEERHAATPLYLLLDDIAGASLISVAGWAQWDMAAFSDMLGDRSPAEFGEMLKTRQDVCIGHTEGSSAQDPARFNRNYGEADAAELVRPDDPIGWHALPPLPGPGLRRARRIDVRLGQAIGGEAIEIDSEFQDSAPRPGGGRGVVHEYGLTARADPVSLALLSVEPTPRVLPYPECPRAVGEIDRLLGQPLTALREAVLAELAGPAGCTHLNDAMRALAETPALLSRIA